jgi:hypothetical protein
MDEQATLNPGAGAKAWYPQEDDFFSHNERKYIQYKVGEIDAGKLAMVNSFRPSNFTQGKAPTPSAELVMNQFIAIDCLFSF